MVYYPRWSFRLTTKISYIISSQYMKFSELHDPILPPPKICLMSSRKLLLDFCYTLRYISPGQPSSSSKHRYLIISTKKKITSKRDYYSILKEYVHFLRIYLQTGIPYLSL